MGILSSILGIGEKVMEKISPDRAASRQQQTELNTAEIQGAPVSRLRLWRSFLGWALSLAFLWEACVRPVVAHYWPDANLPPSTIKEISTILLGMLGLGF